MNIIFGDSATVLPDHYIKLELDTFRSPNGSRSVTSYCLVEKLTVNELPSPEPYKKIHADLLEAYKQKHWNYCQQAIQALMGHWGGELDTFYQDLSQRVNKYQASDPGAEWDAAIVKEGI
jgi:hypothetical protein